MTSPSWRWGSAWSMTLFPRDFSRCRDDGGKARSYVIEFQGELDASSRGELGLQLRRVLEFGVPVTLDLSKLDFCGVAALEELATIVAEARARTLALEIVAPENLSRYFSLIWEAREQEPLERQTRMHVEDG